MEFSRKVLFNKAGGNAGKDNFSYKISLPVKAIEVLKVDEENRDVVVNVKKDHIVIRRLEKMYKVNGIEIKIGDWMRLYDYDTVVDEAVTPSMMENIEDKGEYFEISLANTEERENLGTGWGYIVYANLYKKDLMAHNGYKETKESNPELTDWEVLDKFFDEWGSCSSFWDLEVEIAKVETW